MTSSKHPLCVAPTVQTPRALGMDARLTATPTCGIHRQWVQRIAGFLAGLSALGMAAGDIEPALKHRLTLGYRATFNVGVNFQNLGQGPVSDPGNTAPATPHTYDDGYVLPDGSGNAGGLTWNWGYDADRQVVGDQLLFSASERGTLASDVTETPAHGVELTCALELRRFEYCRLGVMAGLGLGWIDVRANQTARPGVLTVDAYELGGILPPQAPYRGSFEGPGALIGDSPTRLAVAVAAELEAVCFGFRLGPYLEIPLTSRLSVNLGGGLLVVAADAEFAYDQTVATPLPDAWRVSGTVSESEVLPGVYLAGEVAWQLTQSTRVFAGLQYQHAGRFNLNAADKRATLDWRNAWGLTAGAGWSF